MRIAVIGAGPAGLYAVDEICRVLPDCAIDVFERLPAPFGLLRYGVAPDHLKMKSLERLFDRVLERSNVRLLGNVEFGRDIRREQLLRYYDKIVYATGAPRSRSLNLPGEQLAGCGPAADFVAWYNGSPDCNFDVATLEAASVALIGAGNVSIDVARILLKPPGALLGTDAPPAVLEVLSRHRIRDIHVLCRRSAAHARFTTKELLELDELPDVGIAVEPPELPLGPEGEELARSDANAQHNVDALRNWAGRPARVAGRRITFWFNATPVAVLGTTRVESLKYALPGTEERRELSVQAVFSSIGSFGVPLPDLPFDTQAGTIPNRDGHLDSEGRPVRREFVTGWAGRGARGVLGTNKSDAMNIAGAIAASGTDSAFRPAGDILQDLSDRGVRVVKLTGWRNIAAAERALGQRSGRARAKITGWNSLLSASDSQP